MIYEEITQCRSGAEGPLLQVADFGQLYLNDYIEPGLDHESYPKAPIELVFNETSKLLQNRHTVSRSALYDDYWYRSGINESMVKHLGKVAEFAVSQVKMQEGDFILDIASNDGTLLRSYKGVVPCRYKTIGYDPAKNLAEEGQQGVDYDIRECFSADHYLGSGFPLPKVITACAVVYHAPDTRQFLQDVARILHPEGVFVCEFTSLLSIIRNRAFDAIGHEHCTHLSFTAYKQLIEQVGLKVLNVEMQKINSGTLLVTATSQDSSLEPVQSEIDLMLSVESSVGVTSLERLRRFFSYGEKTIKPHLCEFIEMLCNNNHTVAAYGASTKGSILLQWLGLDVKQIPYAVERNPLKVGKEMVGLRIPIISEEEARKLNPEYMLVLPWAFRESFIEREQAYLEGGGKLIFPLPTVEVIEHVP